VRTSVRTFSVAFATRIRRTVSLGRYRYAIPGWSGAQNASRVAAATPETIAAAADVPGGPIAVPPPKSAALAVAGAKKAIAPPKLEPQPLAEPQPVVGAPELTQRLPELRLPPTARTPG
jgi:hypothetical protein